ncbi:MFS transporter [Natrarchaeobius halalkaliphilus]|uniref:MFS transporter n=1 Tax=Natrarchaeobius halalkaliphilus TaxID=1679091 RepID=A0A3N6LHL9_9EURY|nr:MFS transporter [Natrarchaeobius halalkaliphilus]RQG86644.1 MFS transporter [Natrarchaeobius halalkaliphilus]
MNWQYRYSVLVLCTLAFFVTYFARLAVSPVVPFIIDDFEISNTLIGVALSGMWLAYGLAQFPSGILSDRYGEKPIILIAVGGTAVVSVLLALSPVFGAFVVAAVVLGGVAGLHYSVASALLSVTFDDLGTAIGIHSIGGPLAGLVAPVAAAWVGVRYGWRPAIALTAVVGVPIFVLVLLWIRPTEPRQPDKPLRDSLELRTVVELISRPAIAFPLLIAIAGTYVVQGLLSFFPAFLVAFHEYSPTAAGVAFSAFFLVRTVSQIVLGRASDAYGRDIAIAGSMMAGAVGVPLVILDSGTVTMAAGITLVAVASSFFAVIDPRFMDALSVEERGSGFGLVRTVYTVVGAAGSVGVGLTADLFGWGVAFGTLAALFAISFLSVVVNRMLGLGY